MAAPYSPLFSKAGFREAIKHNVALCVADANALTRSHNSHYVLIAAAIGRGLQEKGGSTFNQQRGQQNRAAVCDRPSVGTLQLMNKKKTFFLSIDSQLTFNWKKKVVILPLEWQPASVPVEGSLKDWWTDTGRWAFSMLIVWTIRLNIPTLTASGYSMQ